MIRFIHAADLHLDSLMKGIRSERAGIDPAVFRLSTRKALENLVSWAIDEKVDFVTLGGDNYDADWKDYGTGLFFTRQMARLAEAGIPVVSINGNHDAANRITRSLRLPDSFTMLSVDEPQTVEPIDGVRVIGQGFRTAAEKRNLVVDYPVNEGGGIVIGLLHTSLAGGTRDGHDNYAPCDFADLRSRRYHFWGLGHIHKHGWMHESGDVPVLYPGNPQGRHIGETGAKGAWLIELDEDGAMTDARFRPLDEARWELFRIDVSAMGRVDECLSTIESELARSVREAAHRPIAARIQLIGRSAIHKHLRLMAERAEDQLLAECQNVANQAFGDQVWVEKVELRSAAPPSASPSSEAMRVLNDFVADSAASAAWIAEFQATPEISRLRRQADYFETLDEHKTLTELFDIETILDLVREIPEVLEARLHDTLGETEEA